MEDAKMYLKPNVVLEPLFDRWYAWAHLISPATSAMNVANRHLKILDSYLKSPEIHAAAAKNPKMRGGPFIDFKSPRLDEAKRLKEGLLNDRANVLAFSNDLKLLSGLLKKEATGYSMDSIYSKVPESLKGFVELVYDLNNNPAFRLFESLLYNSEYYREECQSVALWETNNDERPFVLSTPRLDEPGVLHVQIPFKSPAIDHLSQMRWTSGNVNQIARGFKIERAQLDLFKSFFWEQPPPSYEVYRGDKVRMRYFGHACILVETKDVSILVDPVVSYYGYSSDVSRYSLADLPDRIDYVLITHNHQDHVLLETLLSIRHKIGNLIVPRGGNGSLQDPNLKLMLTHLGFKNVYELGDFEAIKKENCELTGIPFIGEHSDLDIRTKICHHLRVGQFSLLFVADSCNIEPKLYEHVRKITGPVDCVFLGMECDGAPLTWLYGPLLSEDLPRDMDITRRLAGSNFERGQALIEAFTPREVYVYAMGMEPWLEFISSIKYTNESRPIVHSNQLLEYCRNRGIVAERLYGEKELFYEIIPALQI